MAGTTLFFFEVSPFSDSFDFKAEKTGLSAALILPWEWNLGDAVDYVLGQHFRNGCLPATTSK
jgi:hypothetical protein